MISYCLFSCKGKKFISPVFFLLTTFFSDLFPTVVFPCFSWTQILFTNRMPNRPYHASQQWLALFWRYLISKAIEEQDLTALDLNSMLPEFYSISFKCQLGNFRLNKIYHSSTVDLSIFRNKAKVQLFLSGNSLVTVVFEWQLLKFFF